MEIIKSRLVLSALLLAISAPCAFPQALPGSYVPGGVTFTAASPTVCDDLVTTYSATGDLITASATQVVLLISFNNLATTNFFAMSQVNSTTWTYTNAIPDTATNVLVAFQSTTNLDANTNGNGFTIGIAACSTGIVPLTVSPLPITACSDMQVRYETSNTVFSGSSNVTLRIHYDTDPTVLSNAMTRTGSVFFAEVDIPSNAANAIMTFDDGTNTDNNSGAEYVVAISSCGGGGGGTSGFFAVRGDLDGDGLGDLVLKDESSGTYFLMFMDLLDAIGGVDFLGTPTDISPFRLAASSDVDGDGFEDLIFQQGEGGVHVVAFMQFGELVDAAYVTWEGESDLGPWNVVAGGDLDGDGFGELVLKEDGSGVYVIAFMDGADILTSEFLFGGEALDVTPWRVAAGGDLDGDGNADLIFRYGDESVYAIGFMDGAFMVNSAYFLGEETDVKPWKLVAASDLDGDGFSELIFKHGNDDLYDAAFMDAQNILLSGYLFGATNIAPWEVVGGK